MHKRGEGLFGALAVFYLFLGGAGAGVLAVCSLVDLIGVKQPFGTSKYVPGPSVAPANRIVDYGFLIGLITLVVGTLALLFDLGRIDRALALFLNPSFSWLTVGSFALVVLALAGAFLALVRFAYIPEITRSVVIVVESIAALVAVLVMLYTGFLLQSIDGVAFWNSLLIPVLFLLSSLSSGIAVVLVIGKFVDEDAPGTYMLRRLVYVDIVIIALEVVCAVAFVVMMSASDHPGVVESMNILTQGNVALAWWFGFGLCGLVVPLAIEAIFGTRKAELRTAFAIAAAFVLIGAFCLRWSIVESGTHRERVLEEVDSGANDNLVLEKVDANMHGNLMLEAPDGKPTQRFRLEPSASQTLGIHASYTIAGDAMDSEE